MGRLKFMFSQKTTKFDKIFTVELTLCSKFQMVKISSIFVAFLENMNFKYSELSNKREVYLILFEKIFPTPRCFTYPNEKSPNSTFISTPLLLESSE